VAAKIGDDDCSAGELGTAAKQMDHGLRAQMMRHLTHQHNVHTLVAEGWGAGTADSGRKTATMGECGGGAAQF
jgi:hypothetical protein